MPALAMAAPLGIDEKDDDEDGDETLWKLHSDKL
jgi:hypothetical protein